VLLLIFRLTPLGLIAKRCTTCEQPSSYCVPEERLVCRISQQTFPLMLKMKTGFLGFSAILGTRQARHAVVKR